MTWVKSHLLRPDHTPVVGSCVSATLMLRPGWTRDGTGRVLGQVATNTDATGLWRLNLAPWTDFEDQLQDHLYYLIDEDKTGNVWNIRVPPVANPDIDELWLRNLIVNPPPGPAPWIPIDTLRRLRDVDAASLDTASPGDALVLLPSGKWGAGRPYQLSVTWSPHPTEMLGVLISVTGYGGKGARLDFGDGTDPIDVFTPVDIPHVYARPGRYEVVATDLIYPAFQGTATVVIKDHAPVAYAFTDPDDDWTTQLWIDEPRDDTVFLVDWGDGSDVEEHFGLMAKARVPARPRIPHHYGQLGRWPILVTDTSTGRVCEIEFETGLIGCIFVFDQGPYQPRMIAMWMVTGASWAIDWGDGQPPQTGVVSPTGRISVSVPHPMPAGTYRITLTETVNGVLRRTVIRDLVVPSLWDWELRVWTGWRESQQAERDDTAMILRVQARNARVMCWVDWGDGSPRDTLAVGGTVSHQYPYPLPTSGRMLRVEEDGPSLPPGVTPRHFVRLLGEPRYVGQPTLAAGAIGQVGMNVAGIAGITGLDWYQINWGDGTSSQDIGAIGDWSASHHVYLAEGNYTITVDGPGMPVPITRIAKVIFYPSPRIAVGEDTASGDAHRLTALIGVNNADSGGPVRVTFDDGTPAVTLPENGQVSHRYADIGHVMEYWPQVVSLADPTAQDRKPIIVPFSGSGPTTIEFTVTAGETPPTYIGILVVDSANPDKSMVVDWGDGEVGQISLGLPYAHLWAVEGTYLITVMYTDGSDSQAQSVTIPFTSDTKET